MSLGERIKTARISKGISQKELADLLSTTEEPVSNSAVSNWENDINKPNTTILSYICEYLSVEANYLLGMKEYEKVNVYTDPDTGLTVQLKPTDKPWEEHTKEEKEQRITQAIDELYKFKLNIKNNDKP